VGALKHHIIDKDNTLTRMLWQKVIQKPYLIGAI